MGKKLTWDEYKVNYYDWEKKISKLQVNSPKSKHHGKIVTNCRPIHEYSYQGYDRYLITSKDEDGNRVKLAYTSFEKVDDKPEAIVDSFGVFF